MLLLLVNCGISSLGETGGLRLVGHRFLQTKAAFWTDHGSSGLGVYAGIQQTHALEYDLSFLSG